MLWAGVCGIAGPDARVDEIASSDRMKPAAHSAPLIE
jgi:hypothetical protein